MSETASKIQRLTNTEAGFNVDYPFSWNDGSTTVDQVDYVFYRFPVEQLYDEATYRGITIPEAVTVPFNSPSVTYVNI